ncbi:hypothetical protein CRI77_24750 [Mycolicibacterium duvalii]|uniref:Uncharacterized protein n=1 Tax=Mycolicibacterium duvalii TaxID=39688 RepID=A0A7I7KAA5_9MYCO|nr:DUF5336 domain-containing protein [Mycolicibacterium duvalii]MCV7368328.1 DUF5336 domain-containing protein [Mycolicibacterium duvalii]PEG35675.1 hypothetical protein CRI77_24750 [Mycolicibacterium duvalii]BBX20428.1 hypothetical protein MDUV_52880 [Mycolicibacterium duvalii]
MSYPQGPPGGPGYPGAQQPTTQFSAPTQQFGKVSDQDFGAPLASKLPLYLTAAVAVLGLLVYLSSFAPQFTVSSSDFPLLGEITGSSVGLMLAVIASVVAALVAGLGLLPKQRSPFNVAAIAAVLSFLLVIAEVVNKPGDASVGWGLYLVIAFTLLQAAVAVVALLFDSGIVNAPAPRPKYDQSQQYGQYPGYYGQPPGQPQHGGHQQQRPGYPTPYGGGSGYPSTGPSTGGFPATSPPSTQTTPQSAPQSGPPTPPTGFPTYGQPPSGNAPGAQHPPSSSSQSGQQSS